MNTKIAAKGQIPQNSLFFSLLAGNLPWPVRLIMGRGAGLHADKARRQRFEERYHLAAPKLLPDDDLLGRVYAVNLEHVLGEIQTDRGNLHVDGPLM